jgi:hypothetical protein
MIQQIPAKVLFCTKWSPVMRCMGESWPCYVPVLDEPVFPALF